MDRVFPRRCVLLILAAASVLLVYGLARSAEAQVTNAQERTQWSPMLPLSGGGAIGSPGGTHPIVADGNTLHAVWVAGGKIHYRRSTDAGMTWGETKEIVSGGTAVYPCSLELSGSTLHLIWPDKRNGGSLGGNLGEIYYKRSTDGGNTWGSDVRVAPGMNFFRIGTAICGSAIHLTWSEQGDRIPNPDNYRWYKGTIYYKRSTDGGNTWEPNVLLTSKNDFNHERPAVTASGQCVHVAWIDGRDSQKDIQWDTDIYYKRSTDGGATWGPEIRMNNNPGYMARHPQIVATPAGQACLIYEMGQKYDPTTKTNKWSGDPALYAVVSSDNGQTWAKSKRITFVNAPKEWATHSKSCVSASRIHLVWTDVPETGHPQKAYSVYYMTSPDGGLTWEVPERLTSVPEGECGASGVGGTESYVVVLISRGETLSYRRRDIVAQPARSSGTVQSSERRYSQ